MATNQSRLRISDETKTLLKEKKHDLKIKEEFKREKNPELKTTDFKWRNDGNRKISNDVLIREALKQFKAADIEEVTEE